MSPQTQTLIVSAIEGYLEGCGLSHTAKVLRDEAKHKIPGPEKPLGPDPCDPETSKRRAELKRLLQKGQFREAVDLVK